MAAGPVSGANGRAGGANGRADTPRRAARPCPECERPAVAPHAPFCSARCRQLDLGRWLNGSYAIPGDPLEPEDLADLPADAFDPPTRQS